MDTHTTQSQSALNGSSDRATEMKKSYKTVHPATGRQSRRRRSRKPNNNNNKNNNNNDPPVNNSDSEESMPLGDPDFEKTPKEDRSYRVILQPREVLELGPHETKTSLLERVQHLPINVDRLVHSGSFIPTVNFPIEMIRKLGLHPSRVVHYPGPDPLIEGVKYQLDNHGIRDYFVSYAVSGPYGTTYNGVWKIQGRSVLVKIGNIVLTHPLFDPEQHAIIALVDTYRLNPYQAPLIVFMRKTLAGQALAVVPPTPIGLVKAASIKNIRLLPGFDKHFHNLIERLDEGQPAFFSTELDYELRNVLYLRGITDYSLNTLSANCAKIIDKLDLARVVAEGCWLDVELDIIPLTYYYTYCHHGIVSNQIHDGYSDIVEEVKLFEASKEDPPMYDWKFFARFLFYFIFSGMCACSLIPLAYLWFVIPLLFGTSYFAASRWMGSIGTLFQPNRRPYMAFFELNRQTTWWWLLVTTLVEHWLITKFFGLSYGFVEFLFRCWFFREFDFVWIIPLIGHLIFYRVGPLFGLILHVWYNFIVWACDTRKIDLFANNFMNYYSQYWTDHGLIYSVSSQVNVTLFDPKLAPIRCAEGLADPPVNNLLFSPFVESFWVNEFAKPKIGYYALVPTSVPGYVFSGSRWNRYLAFATRACRTPLLMKDKSKAAWEDELFANFRRYLVNAIVYKPDCYKPQLQEKFLLHFSGNKRQMYERAMADNKISMVTPDSHTVNKSQFFHKRDELLVKLSDPPTLKPRIINNIDVHVQCALGPYIDELSKGIKYGLEVWQTEPFVLGRWKLRFYWGAGRTDKELSAWYNGVLEHLRENDVYIIAAGDDCLVFVQIGHRVYVIEGDASAFDQTEGYGPLHHQILLMIMLGFPSDLANILWKTFHSTISTVMDGFRLRFVRRDHPTRNTGGPDTTFGNTCIMFSAWAYVFRYLSSFDDLEKLFARIGIEMKIKLYVYTWAELLTTGTPASFLKGLFYPAVDGSFQWGPAPSRILKLGKSFKDPRIIYKQKYCPKPSFYDASAQFMHDVCYGLLGFNNCRLVENYLRRFIDPSRSFLINHLESYKTQLAGLKIPLDDKKCTQLICLRYSFSLEEYNSLCAMTNYLVLFSFFEHPSLLKLASVDYS
jgi:hypothetical protein